MRKGGDCVLQNILLGLGAAVSWMLPLFFLGYAPSAVLFHGLGAGGLLAGALWGLELLELSQLSSPVALVIFLLMTLVLGLEKGSSHGNGALAFLMAQGAFGLFTLSLGFDHWMLIAPAVLLVFTGSAFLLKRFYPEAGWQEYFSGATPPDKKLDVRLWHLYTLALSQCLLCSLVPHLLQPSSTQGRWALLLLLWFVYFGCLLGVCILIAYRRETVAALIDQQYRREMQSFMDVIRSQRHDYNFHVQTLSRLLHEENLEVCRKYVNELVQDSIRMNTLLPIQDPAISAMIHNFQTLAARKGIELHIEVQNDLSRVVTSVYETNKVISNLLQNAIDEISGHHDQHGSIDLTILKRGEYCVIHVSNPFYGNVEAGTYIENIYRHGYTTKPGHDGVGLSSIKTLLERHKGLIYTRIEEGQIRFTAKIPLRYAQNTEDTMQREEQI